MNKEQEKLVALLLQKQSVQGMKLRESLRLDIPSFYHAIDEINAQIAHTGASIRSTASGYITIIASNAESIHQLKKEISLFAVGQDSDYRIIHIAEKLLRADTYLKIDDLAEEYFVSSRQISTDLREVRNLLSGYNITVKTVPHYGMIAVGAELNKRICLAALYLNDFRKDGMSDMFASEHANEIDTIRSILSDTLMENRVDLTDTSFENLVAHLFVSLIRIRSGNDVELPVLSHSEIHSNQQVAAIIVQRLEEAFKVHFSDQEENYVMIHLQSERNYNAEEYALPVPPEIMNLTTAFLNRADAAYGLNLSQDLKLNTTLALHLIPLMSRLRYGIPHENPMLEEIRKNYIYEYEIASAGCREIETTMHCKISADEIGFIALDIAMSLRQRYAQPQCRLLLVCSTGRGTAQLLKMQFMETFSSYISSFETVSVREAENMDLEQYDYIFTTVPLYADTHTPIFMINAFLRNADLHEIRDVFRLNMNVDRMHKYFPQDLFIGSSSLRTKEEILRYMSSYIMERRKVSKDFYELVLQREEQAVTSFGNSVAFPHPARIASEETFVCLLITEQPVYWGNEEVRIILMASIAEGRTNHAELQEFYKAIGKIVRDAGNAEMLMEQPDYDTLMKIVFSQENN